MVEDETLKTAFFADCLGNDAFCSCGGRCVSGDLGRLGGVCGLKFFERADGAGSEEDVA